MRIVLATLLLAGAFAVAPSLVALTADQSSVSVACAGKDYKGS
jgi:hypothetical protein